MGGENLYWFAPNGQDWLDPLGLDKWCKNSKVKTEPNTAFFGQVEQMLLVDNILLPILPNLMEEQHQPALKNNPNIDPKTKISTVIFQR